MKRTPLIIIIVLFCTAALSGVDSLIMEVESGVTWLHSETYKIEADGNIGYDPDPVIYRVGLAFPVYFSDSFFLRPSLTVISKSWEFVPLYNWAMPVDSMWQDLMVMSFLLDVTVGYQINFKSFSLAFFAGPSLDFKIPLWGEGEEVRDDMTAFFYGNGNFFYVTGGLFFTIPLSKNVSVTLKADSWIPINNLWENSGLPFSDGLMVTVGAGVRFIF